jgi:hypothetical protein
MILIAVSQGPYQFFDSRIADSLTDAMGDR